MIFGQERRMEQMLKDANLPLEFLFTEYVEPNWKFKDDEQDISLIKEAFSMKEEEENQITRLFASNTLTGEDLEAKMVEACLRKTINSYSYLERLLKKFALAWQEKIEAKSSIIKQFIDLMGHCPQKLYHLLWIYRDARFFEWSDVYSVLLEIEEVKPQITHVLM